MIHENSADAESKIQDIEFIVKKINDISPKFEALFEKKMTETIFQKILNEQDVIKQEYFENVADEISRLKIKNPTIVNSMKRGMVDDITNFLNTINIGEVNFSQAIGLITFKNGNCFVSDMNKEAIKDKFRIFLTSTEQEEMYNLQNLIVDSMNKFLELESKFFGSRVIQRKNLLLSFEFAKFNSESNAYTPEIIDYNLVQDLLSRFVNIKN